MPITPKNLLADLLVDTWWFALTRRLPDEQFLALAQRRVAQGFTAVQLVVGIPPEVGPENENAASPAGFPWHPAGTFNEAYLAFARQRIQQLNRLGLRVIVYGGWGHQIDWLGQAGMAAWWYKLIAALDDLDVVYCLTGESNIWLAGEARQLLPDKSTASFPTSQLHEWAARLPYRVQDWLIRGVQGIKRPFLQRRRQTRRHQWSELLADVSQLTERPFIIHTLPQEASDEVVENPGLLAAVTTQTGHSEAMRPQLWQRPLTHEGQPFINLEPWYEGILDGFGPEDQLYAYWVSLLAGCQSFCYGAHGIWNVGDGRFLAQWGRQTFEQALALDTPRLLGLSHHAFLAAKRTNSRIFYEANGDQLITIGQKGPDGLIQYFPDVAQATALPKGRIWLPLPGVWSDHRPASGQIVVFDTL